MSTLTYNVVQTPNETFVTVFLPGYDPLAARNDHQNYDAILADIAEVTRLDLAGRPDEAFEAAKKLLSLFDLTSEISAKFENLSERISVKNGHVFVDGDSVDDRLTQHIIRAYEEGGDFKPLVAFFENLLANPLGHAREALYPWIERCPLTITEDGLVVGYKSVFRGTDEDGEVFYRPTHIGAGVVNGVPIPANKHITQRPGDVVEMSRSTVIFEPSASCAEGLHIGDWTYANGFSGDTVLEVHFNPRDVVSVPNDGNKIRVCRYTVVKPVTKAYDEAVLRNPDDLSYCDYDEEEEQCWECGECEDYCCCD